LQCLHRVTNFLIDVLKSTLAFSVCIWLADKEWKDFQSCTKSKKIDYGKLALFGPAAGGQSEMNCP
jgi:hypothetical protein